MISLGNRERGERNPLGERLRWLYIKLLFTSKIPRLIIQGESYLHSITQANISL